MTLTEYGAYEIRSQWINITKTIVSNCQPNLILMSVPSTKQVNQAFVYAPEKTLIQDEYVNAL